MLFEFIFWSGCHIYLSVVDQCREVNVNVISKKEKKQYY